MGNYNISSISSVFDDIENKSKKAVKTTLLTYFKQAGKVTRKTRNKQKGNKPRKSGSGTPFKVFRDSWADPSYYKGYDKKETSSGVSFDYTLVSSQAQYSGLNWVKTMEHGGKGLAGKNLVKRISINFINDIKNKPKRKRKIK